MREQEMRGQIEKKCRNLYTGSSPVLDELCCCILLGRETIQQLEEPLEATWNSQFCFVDHFISIRAEQFAVEEAATAFRESLQGAPVSQLKLEFVALMADPVWEQPDLYEQLEEFCEAVQEMQLDYGMRMQVEWIGVLEAEKPRRKGYDYTRAFQVLAAGYPSCWRAVYHVERGILERDFSKVCHCIANKMLVEFKGSGQEAEYRRKPEDYSWSSLWIEEQQVSQSLLCQALLDCYEEALQEQSRRAPFPLCSVRFSAASYAELAKGLLFRPDYERIFLEGRRYLPRAGEAMPDLLDEGILGFVRKNCRREEPFEEQCLNILKEILRSHWEEAGLIAGELEQLREEFEQKTQAGEKELHRQSPRDEAAYLDLFLHQQLQEATLQSLECLTGWLKREPDRIYRLEQEERIRLEQEQNELRRLRLHVYSLPVEGAQQELSMGPAGWFQSAEKLLAQVEPEQIRALVTRYLKEHADAILVSLYSHVEEKMATQVNIGIGMGDSFQSWKCCLLHPSVAVSVQGVDIRKSEMIRRDSIRVIAGKQWPSYRNLKKYAGD